MSRVAAVIISAFVGVAIGAVAGFAHADRIVIAGTSIPYGLVLALLICILMVLWLKRYFQTRLAGIAFLLGWVAITLQLAMESTTGDLVFSATWYSGAYILAGALLLATSATLPPMRALQSKSPKDADLLNY